jgi:epoxyqueuosine reductase
MGCLRKRCLHWLSAVQYLPSASLIQSLAARHGFDLAGVAPALPAHSESEQYLDWVARGMAGRMSYLTDHRAGIRSDPRNLLPGARSIICVARLYNAPASGPVSRYARTEDYHDTMRRDMVGLVNTIQAELGPFEHRVCVDTAPLLERSYARLAGLGWIGRNTCLISQELGSYVFLGEILTSLHLEFGVPAPDRCGTCRRCIDACPTDALVPGGLRTELDATRCISYLTIELRGDIPEEQREGISTLAFGCDICQEVCPWNRKAPFAGETDSPDLERLAQLTPEEFREQFRRTPVWRSKYSGLLRNVAVAMGNSRDSRHRQTLQRLASHEDVVIRSHAEWALGRLVD